MLRSLSSSNFSVITDDMKDMTFKRLCFGLVYGLVCCNGFLFHSLLCDLDFEPLIFDFEFLILLSVQHLLDLNHLDLTS
ncbi:hypothetical protein Tco_0689124 [Tanacetum coccineum]